MNNSKKLNGTARRFAGLFATTALSALMATAGASTNAHALACLDEAFGGSTSCVSNDIKVASISVLNVVEACDGSPGDTFTFDGTLNVESSAMSRYDLGFYIGVDPQLSTNDDCSVAVIPPSSGDLDGDQCGDVVSSAAVAVPVFGIVAPCQDGDNDGFFDVNACSSWEVNSGDVCTGPADAVPGSAPKCNCETVATDEPIPHCSQPEYQGICDDGNECTDDLCNPFGSGLGDFFGCTNTNNSAPCDDGLFCNGIDTCAGGSCAGHAGDPCAQGGVCGDQCNEDTDDCFVDAGTECRASAGVCDTAET
ncbi:MAG: hypothetical protein ABR538_07180, partial [Candidatus Binatia bacterium]